VDLIALALIIWSRVLLRRPGAPLWLRWVMPVLLVGFVMSLGGTALGLKWAFHAAEGVPADQKATVLAAGISRAMWVALIGVVLDGVAFAALVAVTLRRR
jgi:hypothetical protein